MSGLGEWLGQMKPGELLGWVTGVSTVVITFWTALGKRSETIFSRIESERKHITEERDRLTSQLKDCEKERYECEDSADKLKQENDFLKAGHRAFLEFAEDVKGGSYGLDWIKARAEQLLQRYKT